MNDCAKYNETSLPKKEDFYSILKMEFITCQDCRDESKVWNDFGIKP